MELPVYFPTRVQMSSKIFHTSLVNGALYPDFPYLAESAANRHIWYGNAGLIDSEDSPRLTV